MQELTPTWPRAGAQGPVHPLLGPRGSWSQCWLPQASHTPWGTRQSIKLPAFIYKSYLKARLLLFLLFVLLFLFFFL